MTPVDQPVFAAVDIGASGGRVIAGWIADGKINTEIVHRFDNGPRDAMRPGADPFPAGTSGAHPTDVAGSDPTDVAGSDSTGTHGTEHADTGLRWDVRGLYAEVITGLRLLASRFPTVVSIGIDTWAVDYGLLDADGELIEDPHCYRDPRTADAVRVVHERIDPAELYGITGLQFLPFNTIYQLMAEQRCPAWQRAATIVMLPDLLGYWLTGELGTDVTNASSTGLLDARTRDWSPRLLELIGVGEDQLPPIQPAGTVRGGLRPEVIKETGLPSEVVLTSIGSHDTASAVVGVPATEPGFGYISSGTWSLVGLELAEPILTEPSRRANFTNEGGVDGRIRYLRNEGGLWLLQESLRQWRADGVDVDLGQLLAAAGDLLAGGPTVEVGAEEFIVPGGMPDRIAAACRRPGQQIPVTPAEITRCVIDSLAVAYRRALTEAAELSGRRIDRVHVVGGGSQNALLCRLTAEATGKTVIAGPVEATALGNLLIQARTHGAVSGSLEDLRSLVVASSELTEYRP